MSLALRFSRKSKVSVLLSITYTSILLTLISTVATLQRTTALSPVSSAELGATSASIEIVGTGSVEGVPPMENIDTN